MSWFCDPYWTEALDVAIGLAETHRVVFVPHEWLSFSPKFLPIEFSEGELWERAAFVVVHDNVHRLSLGFRNAFDVNLLPVFANEVFTAGAASCTRQKNRLHGPGLEYFREKLRQVEQVDTLNFSMGVNADLSCVGPKPVVLLNANGMGNVGDDLMAKLATDWVRRIAPRGGVTAAGFDLHRSHLESCSYLLIAGGGLLSDAQRPYCDLANLGFCFGPLLITKEKGIPSGVISLGSQGLVSKAGQDYAARALACAGKITTRDRATSDLIAQISDGVTQSHVAPDMVFGLDVDLTNTPAPKRPVQRVLLSGEIDRYGSGFLDVLLHALQHQGGLDVEFAVMAEEDRRVAQWLRERLVSGNVTFKIIESTGDPMSIAHRYGAADAVITGRLHGLVLALLHKRPVVVIDYPGGKKERLIRDFFPSMLDALVLGFFQGPSDFASTLQALLNGQGLAPTDSEWSRARHGSHAHYEMIESQLSAAGVSGFDGQ